MYKGHLQKPAANIIIMVEILKAFSLKMKEDIIPTVTNITLGLLASARQPHKYIHRIGKKETKLALLIDNRIVYIQNEEWSMKSTIQEENLTRALDKINNI